MDMKFLKKSIMYALALTLFVTLTNCTSSDEDSTELDSEIENIDMDANEDTMADNLDIDEISEDKLVDDLGEEDAFSESKDEVANFDEEDELDEDEFEDTDKSEVASNDADEDFDEFDDIEDKESPDQKEFAKNEQSLENEINQKPIDYPVAENAQPSFPEEVIGAETNIPPPIPLANDGTITSETQDIGLYDANEAKLPQDDLGSADPIVPLDDDVENQTQSWVPVVKVKTDPFFRNQRLMNAVYLARPKENIQSISEKLYGSDKSDDLKSDNPHLAKGVDPGDKVYYSSPNRPDDKTILKVYYDDIGLAPQSYVTKTGDNMRRLGSKLLGFPEGWKEVWAINQNIDSKTILPPGVEIKYWTGEEQNKPNLMAAQVTPEQTNTESPTSMGEVEEFAEAELPPEPPLPEAKIAMPENNLEPEIVPDIEPFPEQGVQMTPTPAAAIANPNDSLLSVGAISLLIIAGVGLVAIQIKKRKDRTGLRPQSLEYTQV
jgi:hypothetical protein